MKRASKMPNFWVTAGAQHLRTSAHPLPEGAESAPHRGGNAREKTSKKSLWLCLFLVTRSTLRLSTIFYWGGNAREKTSKRFHFYSPTSAAGTRGVYHVPTTTSLPRRGCINLRHTAQGGGTSSTFKIHSSRHNPTCAVGGRGAIEVRRLRRGKLRC